jgi:hypothetical protein
MSEPSGNLPDDLDERLWIRTAGCDERDFLCGSSHTFPGRMQAYCPHQRHDFSVSKYEVTEASAESALWIEGFLRGNEPVPPEDDDGVDEWRASREAFYRTGDWPRSE